MLYGNGRGYLYEKLRNKARKPNRLVDENENQPVEGVVTNFDELMQFFKNCVVHQQKKRT